MRKFIFILMSLFSLAISADEKLNGGFTIALIFTEGYSAYGDWLAPNEKISDDIGCITGAYVTIINAQTTTDIKDIKTKGDKAYCRLQGKLLKVYSSATLYSMDGKQICNMKGDAQIDTSILPYVFIIKFKDGTIYKLVK